MAPHVYPEASRYLDAGCPKEDGTSVFCKSSRIRYYRKVVINKCTMLIFMFSLLYIYI